MPTNCPDSPHMWRKRGRTSCKTTRNLVWPYMHTSPNTHAHHSYIYIHMTYACMYVSPLYIIPWVSSPHVSCIVYICVLYMRSPESPVPRSPAFIYNPQSLQSPDLQDSIFMHIYVYNPRSLQSPDLQHGLYVFTYTNAPLSIIFVDHHHLDQTRKPYQFLILASTTVTHSNSFFRGL